MNLALIILLMEW